MVYDILLRGATVVDPSQNVHGVFDVAISDRKIHRIATPITRPPRRQEHHDEHRRIGCDA